MANGSIDARLRFDEPMGPHCTYRVGGTVAVFATVASVADIAELSPLWRDRPVRVVGNGSNLLVAPGYHDMVVLHMVDGLAELSWHEDHSAVVVTAGAGLDLPIAARRLAAAGITGFEWAVGVPGTFGGATAMNAGGHGADMADTIVDVQVWRDGATHVVTKQELAMGYRTSSLGASDLVTSVTMSLTRGSVEDAKASLRDIVQWRRMNQPGGANAGSVFRNPDGDHAGRLIEMAGAKGLRMGGAEISPKHANFIIAHEGASAQDIYDLMRAVRDRVARATGVELAVETRCWGFEGAS